MESIKFELEYENKMLLYIVFEYQSAEVSDTPSTTDKLHVSVYRDKAKERGGEGR